MKNGKWKKYDEAEEDEYDTIDGDGNVMKTGKNANNFHSLDNPICAVSIKFKVLSWDTTTDAQLTDDVACT
jgi:hypothetical protein